MARRLVRPRRTTTWVGLLLALLAVAYAGPAVARLHAQLGRLVTVVQVQPLAAEIPIGRSQTFQLLDMNGRLVPSDEWTVSDQSVAELSKADGRATLIGRRDGLVTLTARGGRSDVIRVRARDAELTDVRWTLRPVDGRFTKVLPAASSYYYEDRGRASTHIRAIGKDGLQRWQWPPPLSGGIPVLLATDNTGGALLLVKTRDQRELVNLDSDGQERWRVPAPGLQESGIGVTGSGGVLFVSDTGTARRLVGVNGETGKQEMAVLLDAGKSTQRNFTVQAGGFVCTPGVTRSDTPVLRVTPVVTNARGVASVAYAEWTMSADAGACGAGTRLALTDIRVQAQQRLVLLDIDARFSVTRQILDDSSRDTHGNERGVPMMAPMADLLMAADGSVFLPVRRVSRDWLTGDEGPLGEFVMRLAPETRKPLYRTALPTAAVALANTPAAVATASAAAVNIRLLLDEGGRTVYVSRGQAVLALDTTNGQERWRWTATRGLVEVLMPMKGEAALVRNDGRYIRVMRDQSTVDVDESVLLFGLRSLPTADSQLAGPDPRMRLTLKR